jgi:hypothetical protein
VGHFLAVREVLRRVAPAILLVGGILIGMKLCAAQKRIASVTIVYRLPEDATEISARIGEAAEFRSSLGAEVRQKTRLPPGRHEIQITLTSGDGTSRTLTRRIEVEGDQTITVDLAGD